MKRRQGFTLVELLVAMALILFIMAILSTAFAAATGTFRNLKAAGDMAEKLRATTQLLTRDLAADHFQAKQRLSNPNFWTGGPPQQGYFQIYQGSTGALEGTDIPAGVGSYRSVDHKLAFTIKLRGNQMSDFLSASAPLLSMSANFGPPEARYQSTSGGSYNYQWAEVAWFLQPQGTDTALGTPLYTLYRRQRLAVPDNSLVTPAIPFNNGTLAQCLELSWAPTAVGGNMYFNSPIDLTVPQRRFAGGNPVGFTTIAQDLTNTGASNPSLMGADIQLTDVVSFDVRMLAAGAPASVDPFVTLFQAPFTNYTYTAPTWVPAGMVFDTWSSVNDGISNFSTWNQMPGVAGTTIPFWNGTGPIIQAIQISIRIWDVKTNQTRQVTMIQAM